MATVKENISKTTGQVLSYRLRCCVGRDEKYRQIFRTKNVKYSEIPERYRKRRDTALKYVVSLANAWEAEEKEKYQITGSTTDAMKNIRFKDFVHSVWFPAEIDNGMHKPTTVSFYRYISEDIVAYFGNRKLSQVATIPAIKSYVKYLSTEAVSPRTGRPYSQQTISHLYTRLGKILRYAYRIDAIAKNPYDKLTSADSPKKGMHQIDFLSVDEAHQLLDALEEESAMHKAMVYVMLFTGLRRGEIMGLQWGDFDTETDTIRVSRNVTEDKNSPDHCYIGTPKTETGKRTVPVNQMLKHALTVWKKEQEHLYGAQLMPHAFIFGKVEDPYRLQYPTMPTRMLRRIEEKYGLRKVSPHDLRHTAATLALEAGANIKQVQVLLGHSNPAVTMAFYTGVSEQAQRETVAGIENLLKHDVKKTSEI